MFFRILASSLLNKQLLARMATSKKQDLPSLRKELFERYKEYKPWHSVRVLHVLTMSHYHIEEGQPKALRTQDHHQVNEIITSLAGDIHNLPHREFNLLLEIIK